MFEERSEQLHRVTTLLDMAVTVLVFLAASWFRNVLLDDDPADLLSHVALLPFVLALWMFFLTFFGAYRSPRMTSALQYAWAVTRGVVVGLASLLTILFLFKVQYVSRVVVVTFAAGDLLALMAIRFGVVWYFHRSLRRGEYFRRILIVGSGTRAKRLAETLVQHSEWGKSGWRRPSFSTPSGASALSATWTRTPRGLASACSNPRCWARSATSAPS